jgi:hypothetical protein
MIKLKDILLEIGDASAKPFAFKKTAGDSAEEYKEKLPDYSDFSNDSNMIEYEFTTDKQTKYIVSIDIDVMRTPGTIQSEVDFGAQTAGGGFSLDDTNLGEQYRVMSTIKEIVFEFIEEWQEHWYIHNLEVAPIKSSDGGDDKDDSIDGVDSRRGKLYLAYIKKNLPKLSKPYGVRVFNDYFLIQPKFENPNDQA